MDVKILQTKIKANTEAITSRENKHKTPASVQEEILELMKKDAEPHPNDDGILAFCISIADDLRALPKIVQIETKQTIISTVLGAWKTVLEHPESCKETESSKSKFKLPAQSMVAQFIMSSS